MLKCFCQGNKKTRSVSHNSSTKDRILPSQKEILKLMFNNLASRCPQNKLSQHNFMLFFPLTGLWGEKMFRHFSREKSSFLSFNELYMGINQIIRGSFDEKVNILFNLIKNPLQQGISYKQFLKMLYHYSKKELKQIMANDGVFVYESIIPSNIDIESCLADSQQIVEVESPEKKNDAANKSYFEKAYEKMIQSSQRENEQSTCLMVEVENKKCMINKINLQSLTQEYATSIFNRYGLRHDAVMLEKHLKKLVMGNSKFLETFFATFHENLWGFTLQKPNFLSFIEKQITIEFVEESNSIRLHMMLVKNVLFLSAGTNKRENVYRVICLDGVSINMESSYKMEIKDVPNNLTKFQLIFRQQADMKQWFNVLRMFSKNYIHSKFQIGEAVATGRFSVVYKCFDRNDGKPYALKVINLSKLDPMQKNSIETETEILKIINYPDFVKHYETVYSKENIYIVMEYLFGEDLFEYVKRKGKLSEYEAAYILGKIIQGVMHLHSLQIIHRDLKPENIMISYHRQMNHDEPESPRKFLQPCAQNIKIIDFGYASFSSNFETTDEVPLVGTPNYIAPQIWIGEKPSFSCDIFAIGSILYFMLSGTFAFYSQSIGETMIRTKIGDYSLSGQIWKEISVQATDLVQQMLELNPRKRISLRQCLNHPWFASLSSFNSPKQKESTDHE